MAFVGIIPFFLSVIPESELIVTISNLWFLKSNASYASLMCCGCTSGSNSNSKSPVSASTFPFASSAYVYLKNTLKAFSLRYMLYPVN